jgi:hypothetical protein
MQGGPKAREVYDATHSASCIGACRSMCLLHQQMERCSKAPYAHDCKQAEGPTTRPYCWAHPSNEQACFGHTSTAPDPCSCCLIARAYCSLFTGSSSALTLYCTHRRQHAKQLDWAQQVSFRRLKTDSLEAELEWSFIGGWHDYCPRSPLSSVEGSMRDTTWWARLQASFRCRAKSLVAVIEGSVTGIYIAFPLVLCDSATAARTSAEGA